MTISEMIVAMAVMAIVFSAVVPQFRNIQNTWASKQGVTECIQNGRVLMDHLNRQLSKAVLITAVSDSAETDGYIEFRTNDATTYRYDIAVNDYVEFGPVGSLTDLAGPVTRLQFTCYGLDDMDTPITDTASIRFITVEATLANSASMGQDKTISTSAYLRTNGNTTQPNAITSETPFEFDTIQANRPAILALDATHYLCAYTGNGDDGWAVVLTVDTGTWGITQETPFEYDTAQGIAPALAQIDNNHYLCAYTGNGDDGWAVVLTVDTGTWGITKETPFEYDTAQGTTPALAQIDATRYLCTYAGADNDGWAVVLTVDTGTWGITKETPFEYDTARGTTPALAQIDATRYLCTYAGADNDGWAVVLIIDTDIWDITNGPPFEYDTLNGTDPVLAQLDEDHYLCVFSGSGADGWTVALNVDLSPLAP